MKTGHLSSFDFGASDIDVGIFFETAASRLAAGGRALAYFAVPEGAASAARNEEVAGAVGVETLMALTPGAGFLFATNM